MLGDGSAVPSTGSGHGVIKQSFSVADSFHCDLFDGGTYAGCEQTLFGISEHEDKIRLNISSLTFDANHDEKSAADIHVTQVAPEYLRSIRECVDTYIETGDVNTIDTGYIQGTHTDEEGARNIIRLSVSVTDRGIDFSSILEGGTDILDYVRIPTTREYREGALDVPVHLERFCSLCKIFISAIESPGDIFEAAEYYLDPRRHFVDELQDRCLTSYPDGELAPLIRTAGTLLEEEVSGIVPHVSSGSPAHLMKLAFGGDNPELDWGYDGSEQEGIMFLYAGAIQALRNPMSHRHPVAGGDRYLDDLDRTTTIDILCFFNFLLSSLERYGASSLERGNRT